MKKRSYNKRIIFVSLSLCALFSSSFFLKKLFIINLTPSAPIGLYFIASTADIRIGDFVLFSPPPAVAELVRERNYLPDGILLIKEVVGATGDEWCVDARRVFRVNGVEIGKAKLADGRGRSLPKLMGCHRIPEQEWLVKGRGDQSFDSRYFGSIRSRDILGKAIAIWRS